MTPMGVIKVGDFGNLKEIQNEKDKLINSLGEHSYDNVLREIGKERIKEHSHLKNLNNVHQPKLF
jgi:hypothetical protein